MRGRRPREQVSVVLGLLRRSKPMSQESLSSTGAEGLARRPDDRLYYNRGGILQADVAFFDRWADRADAFVNRGPESRCVLRTFLTEEGLETVNNSRSRNYIEAAVPICVGGQNQQIYMALFGVNNQSRILQLTRPDFEPNVRMLPRERVRLAQDQGFSFASVIYQHQIPNLEQLWIPIFGWEKGGVENLRMRMQIQRKSNTLPSIWFSGLLYEGQIVSAAMAERLTLPLAPGQTVSIVESTEWCTAPSFSRNGFMAATVGNLHGHVIESMSHVTDPWVVIAETNIQTGAHFVGNAVGMEVPKVQIGTLDVPQALIQNVTIGDGFEPNGLRNFTMMYIPRNNMYMYEGVI